MLNDLVEEFMPRDALCQGYHALMLGGLRVPVRFMPRDALCQGYHGFRIHRVWRPVLLAQNP
jgi:hypothetical protein